MPVPPEEKTVEQDATVPAVVPRPAATVMVVRDRPGGHPAGPLEVLMLRRSLAADFVGGAHVFPGGAVDPQDASDAAASLCDGLDDAGASRILGVESGGLGYWVAAVRECFEEAGVLLACRGNAGPAVSFADPAEAARFLRHRQNLNSGRANFLGVLEAEGLRLALRAIRYVAHWITPEGSPRRYDTRFFVAAAPEGQTPAHDAAETISDVWIRPADALASHEAGEMTMILPTIRSLERLAAFPTAAAALEAADRLDRVPAVLPRIVADADGTRVVLPGDPEYDDPTAVAVDPSSLDPARLDAAVRAAGIRRRKGAP